MNPRQYTDPIRVDSCAWYPDSVVTRERFTVVSKYGDVVNLWKIDPATGLLGLPRGLCPNMGEDARVDGTAIQTELKVPPRNDTQKAILAKAKGLLKANESFILQATTGFGKTYCAANIIDELAVTTLVVVTKEDLMNQWRDALVKFLGIKESDIGIAQGDKCDWKGKKIVLGMVHSVCKGKYGPDFAKYFGLVIFDEVHRMGADTFGEAVSMFPALWRLGLSATPTRGDGKEFLFQAHIGEVKVKAMLVPMKPKAIIQKTKYQLPVWMTEKIEDPITHKMVERYPLQPGRLMHVYKSMANHDGRNDQIVDFVYSAWKKDRNIILFFHLIEDHLEKVWTKTWKRGVPIEQMRRYVGGMKESAREEVKANGKVIFATYKMTAEATDIPRLDTAVFCTPQKDVAQAAGRVLREMEGKKQPVIYDPWDQCHPILNSFLSARRTFYYSLGADVVQL